MALGYLGRGGLARRLAEIGRTALSCYMLQDLLASIAFHDWGLGLGPLDAGGSLLALIVISCLLSLLAHLWLRRHPTGPFEMVWRYLVDRPFRSHDRARALRRPTSPATP